MFKSYFKLAYRHLLKYKLTSFINIMGLSVAISCSIVFFLLLDLEYTSDRFHENAKNIHLVVYTLEGNEKVQLWGNSPQPLGPGLMADIPQINRAVRLHDMGVAVRFKDKVFYESIRFADKDFLDMFTFPLTSGNQTDHSEKNGLILSKDTAKKYFGDKDPVGQQILLIFNETHKEEFVVKGVAAKFPHNASFSFSLLASFEKLNDIYKQDTENWSSFVNATFIEVHNQNDLAAVSAQMDKYLDLHNAANVDRPIESFAFEPLPTLSWRSQNINSSISSGSTPQALILLFIIGLFLLLQACFNYINISLASGTRRFKEIGIRKVMGGQRMQLVSQFLGENLLMCFLALMGGLLVTEFILIPILMGLMESTDKMTLLDFFSNIHLWIFLVLLIILTGLGAGAYPALSISRMQPVSIMKNRVKRGGKKRFTNIMLSLQFGITFLLICLVMAFMQNNQYQHRRDWGYDQENVINIRLSGENQFNILKNEVDLNPNVVQTSGTRHLIGQTQSQAVVEIQAKKHEIVRFDVGFNYLETLKIRIKEGRLFDPKLATDRSLSVVVNEKFVQKMGWSRAINQPVRYENRNYHVIGVVENFHYQFFFEDIEPVLMRIVQEDALQYLSVRVNGNSGTQSAEFLEEVWQRMYPDSVYESFYQDSVFLQGYRNNQTITKIFGLTAVITLIISCMGLFGLVTLIISKRRKELSIHKVLGASSVQISRLISRRYIILLSTAILLSVPMGYLVLKNILDGIYKYHMPLGVGPFLFAGIIVLLTAILTVAVHVYKAAVKDPIDALRYE